MRWRVTAAGVALALACTAPVRAESVAEIRSELNALSAVVADLARELSSGAAASQPGFDGSLIDRVEAIRLELARLTGRSEELEFRIRRVIDEASNRLGDLEFRLTELEGGDPTALPNRPLGGEAPLAGLPSDQPPGGEAPHMAAGERAAFDAARALVDAGDLESAVLALDEFLALFPGSPLGPDASVLLAQTHRARGSETDAARTFLNLYLSDTDGATAPRALLALGDSLGRLGQIEEACIMFDELRDRFPFSPEAGESESLRSTLACS
ncbi:MAG: tetratricopeptide repeat protein [Roseinatronobacter sp.]